MSELEQAIDSLATKIEGLDLTDDELAVLDVVLRAGGGGEPPDVEGFARHGAPDKFGLPDLRGRMNTSIITWGGDVATLFPSRNIVINHEEQ